MLHDLAFAIGDVHGCLSKLQALLDECAAYADGRTSRVVMLGDYVDRGPDSAGVVRWLREAQARDPEGVVCLKGNHEDLLAGAARGWPRETADWLHNGGRDTLKSYGVADARDLPAADVEWMRGLPTSLDDGLRFFVHAGIDPAAPLSDQDDEWILWTRKEWPDGFNPGRLIVHGHTPHRAVVMEAHRIDIDTGAAYGGDLTAAVFDHAQVGPLSFITHDGRVTRLEPLAGMKP